MAVTKHTPTDFDNSIAKYAVTAMGSDYGQIRYHIAFAPRYRRRIFAQDKAKTIFKKQAEICAIEKNFEIEQIEFHDDYVSLCIKSSPYVSPRDIVTQLKIYTGKALLAGIDALKNTKSIWTKHFFVSTLDGCFLDLSEQAMEYARRQPKHG
jgi:putative transposase